MKKDNVMKTPMIPFDTLMENQNKLVDALTQNSQKVMELFKMEDNWTKKGKELFDAYVKEQKSLLEVSMKPESMEKGFEAVAEQWTKALELNWNYANKTMDLMRESVTTMNEPKADNPFTRMFDIYTESVHAMVDTTKKNMDAFRAMWN